MATSTSTRLGRIIVKVSQVYIYPKAMLQRGSMVEDALNKAREDFHADIVHMVNGNHKDVPFMDLLKVETLSEEIFELQEVDKPKKKDYKNVNPVTIANRLAIKDMEVKYGKLEPDINPKLFDFHEDVDKEGNKVIRKELYFLKPQYSKEYANRRDTYLEMFQEME